jgi:hypothetical protein
MTASSWPDLHQINMTFQCFTAMTVLLLSTLIDLFFPGWVELAVAWVL